MADSGKRRSKSILNVSPKPLSIRSLGYRHGGGEGTDVINRVRGEFVEMRGFSPTVEQAARLFDLAPEHCRQVLMNLEREGFLRRTSDGRYRRPA